MPSKRRHRRKDKVGTEIFIPYNAVADSALVAYEARTNSSVTHTIGFLSTLIERFGGDKSKVNLSYTHAYRCRVAAVDKYAEMVQEGWTCSSPAAIHWDGKIMNDITDQYKQKDRLPILVSSGNSCKLLGAPALPLKSSESSGELISTEVLKLLEKWNCHQHIASMVFDTTSSNTGHLSAACISIQMKLGRALLWSACRKHIGELMIAHVWEDLKIEVSSSPEMKLFKRFREIGFESTPYAYTEDRKLSTQEPSTLGDFAERQASVGRQLMQKIQEQKAYERGDYKECLELMKTYMGDNPEYTFLKPGAVHKARWMGKQLYCYKMVLLQDKLPPGIASKAQLEKMQRIVNFCTYVYNIWWFQCPLATSAPALDLELIENLNNYKSIDEQVATSALKSFRRHTWYIHAEMVPLALWDCDMDDDRKEKLAKKILEQPDDADNEEQKEFIGRHGTGYGKPDLLAVNVDAKELHELVTPASWRFFKILGVASSFLNSSPKHWPENAEYMKTAAVLAHFKVTNEDAERSVKLCVDFLGTAKNEDLFQKYMQVVETERKKTPDLRKSTKRKRNE